MECGSPVEDRERLLLPVFGVLHNVSLTCGFVYAGYVRRSCALVLAPHLDRRSYALRKYGLLSASDGSSLAKFAGSVALPLLAFRALAALDLGGVQWPLIGALVAGKLVTFVAGLLVGTLLAGKSGARTKMAGVAAMFGTCSNDFAFGTPVLRALFPSVAPYLVFGCASPRPGPVP